MTRIAVVDSGARGKAIIDIYAKSMRKYQCDFDGMIIGSNCVTSSRSVDLKNPTKVLEVIDDFDPDLVDVANDDCLAYGLVDMLVERGYRVFGPTKEASRIEWDKKWARDFMKRYKIPSPEYQSFQKAQDLKARDFAFHLIDRGKRAFFKASGLCAGKGVEFATRRDEVEQALALVKSKGKASDVFLVEEGLEGEEFSYFVITDGKSFHSFKSAQDNKKLLNNDKGPNTGGMGSHSPALVTKGLEKRIENEIVNPTIWGLINEGINYTGILYIGGIVTHDRKVKVIEFNARWGDPECLVILPGLITNYFDLVTQAIDGKLSNISLREDTLSRVAIVAASKGYPLGYETGKMIEIDHSKFTDEVEMVPAAIVRSDDQNYLSNGGRLFSIVAKDKDLRVARKKAIKGISGFSIGKNGLYYRTDIGMRDVRRLNQVKLHNVASP